MLWLRREYDGFLALFTGATQPVARIEEGDEQHETDKQHGASGLQVLQYFRADRAAANRFNQSQCDMAAVQDRERQQVEHGQIDVDQDAVPENQTPAMLAEKQIAIKPHDHNRPAE